MRKGAVRYKDWKREGFPLWLQQRLEDRGWTITELARQMDVVPSLLSRWMSGRQQPSPNSLRKLADVMQLSHDEVLTVAGYRQPLTTDGDPRKAELIRRISELELTKEHYLTICAVLDSFQDIGAARHP